MVLELATVSGLGDPAARPDLALRFAGDHEVDAVRDRELDVRVSRQCADHEIGPDGQRRLRAAEAERALRDDAEAQVAHCRRICEQAGVPTTARVVFQPPVEAIVPVTAVEEPPRPEPARVDLAAGPRRPRPDPEALVLCLGTIRDTLAERTE